jgi:hypothetical protein
METTSDRALLCTCIFGDYLSDFGKFSYVDFILIKDNGTKDGVENKT